MQTKQQFLSEISRIEKKLLESQALTDIERKYLLLNRFVHKETRQEQNYLP